MKEQPYYVVLMGREPGIYRTWEEVKIQTDCFFGASFKKINNLCEAQKLFKSTEKYSSSNEIKQTQKLSSVLKLVNIYVDGSYHPVHNVYSYAFAVVKNGEIVYSKGEPGKNKKAATILKSEAGELSAAMQAIRYAVNHNYKRVLIYHDNLDIKNLARGIKEPKNEFERMYVKFIEKQSNHIKLDFSKVKAHKKNPFNQYVDKLAKEALYQIINGTKRKTHNEDTFKTVINNKTMYKKLNFCMEIISECPTVVRNGRKERIINIYKMVLLGNKISEEEKLFVLRMERSIKYHLKKEVNNEKATNQSLKEQLDQNYHTVLKYKKELKWFGTFLLKMRRLLIKNKNPTEKQREYIIKGLKMLKKYSKECVS